MGQEINLLDLYPKAKRQIDQRAKLVKETDRAIARKFGVAYFDGDRLTGYGGYNYAPRFWQDTVRRIVDHYQLPEGARVLDIGCAKGYMMYDMKQYRPDLDIQGIDISQYAKDHAKDEVRDLITVANANDLPFEDNSFDLVIAINALHNLPLIDCKEAFREISRVSRKDAFVMNDAWRNDQEQKSMLGWNLTALTYMHVDDWKKLFEEVGYNGDYYWFIAESA
ncbi:class I SAM-dependent methyltransferase [Terasakiella pusilla]|uniref:class I SAM-dependent methyltransferase n=1 Tax=Terasakiella pusilla TaxID=64973 RepID=UPI003AA8D228